MDDQSRKAKEPKALPTRVLDRPRPLFRVEASAHVDIILKRSVHELGKRDPDMTPDKVDNLIDDVTTRVHDAASGDLESFLFDERLTGVVAAAPAQAEVSRDENKSLVHKEGAPSMGEMLSEDLSTHPSVKRSES